MFMKGKGEAICYKDQWHAAYQPQQKYELGIDHGSEQSNAFFFF